MEDWKYFLQSFRKEASPSEGMYLTESLIDFYGDGEIDNKDKYPYYSIQKIGALKIIRSLSKNGRSKENCIRNFMLWQTRESLSSPNIYKRDFEKKGLEYSFEYSHTSDLNWEQCSSIFEKIESKREKIEASPVSLETLDDEEDLELSFAITKIGKLSESKNE